MVKVRSTGTKAMVPVLRTSKSIFVPLATDVLAALPLVAMPNVSQLLKNQLASSPLKVACGYCSLG